MCWELTVTHQGGLIVSFQFSDVPQKVKDNIGDYCERSLGRYLITSCSRPEVLLDDYQVFVWGENREHDNDILNLPKYSFMTLVNILSDNAKVKIKGIDKFYIGGC